MNKLFEIVLLDEAFEFLSNLEKKQYEKILFNIRKAQDMIQNYLKNLKTRSGNSERYIKGFITDCLLFGTRLFLKTPLSFQRTD